MAEGLVFSRNRDGRVGCPRQFGVFKSSADTSHFAFENGQKSLGFCRQETYIFNVGDVTRSRSGATCAGAKGTLSIMIRHSIKVGFSFGLTSGIITTLGLMVGLHSGTGSKLVVLGGILTIAIADAFSDALGIHIAEESENVHSQKEIWESTVSTFFSKFLFALTFIVPILLFDLSTAILVSVIWGLAVLSVISFVMAREQRQNPWTVVAEHLAIALAVIIITHYVGDWISLRFS